MHPRFLVLILICLLFCAACGDTGTSTGSNSTPTTAATTAPTATPTKVPTQKLAPIPSASELSQLFSAKDGKVTDVSDNGGGKIALDIQVYNPTQIKVKHINYLLMQFFFGGRNDVSALNFAFHADGYTGGDDPIAECAGVASEYKLGYDENQLWDAMGGVFNANLPA